jgi:hypothetical protein
VEGRRGEKNKQDEQKDGHRDGNKKKENEPGERDEMNCTEHNDLYSQLRYQQHRYTGILNAVGESYGLGGVALGDGHPPGHAVGKAEDQLHISTDVLLGNGRFVEMEVARISEHTEDVGTGILAGGMHGTVAVQLADELSGVVIDHARMLNAAADKLVVSVDDASHSGVWLGSTLDENLHSRQRVLGLVVLLPAYKRPATS